MSLVEVKKRQIETFAYSVECISLLIFGQMLGNMGIAYLAIAMECVTFVGILLGANAGPIIGRMLRSKNSKGQYKNANRIRNVLFLFHLVLGIIGTVLVALGIKPIVENLLGITNVTFILVIMTPTLSIRMLIAVLLGGFQGEGSEFANVAYAILRQLGILSLGIVLCKTFMSYGLKVSALLGQEVYTSVYGAMGIALAFLVIEVVLLIGLGIVSRLKVRPRKQKADEGMRTVDTIATVVANYASNRKFHLVIYLLLYLPVISGLVLYAKSVGNAQTIAIDYGRYFGVYLLICALAVLLLALLVIPMYGRVASLMRKEEIRLARNAFSAGVHIVIVNGLFATVFIACMSDRIVNFLEGTVISGSATMLKVGSVAILLSLFVILFLGILRALGKELLLIACLVAANVVYLLVTAIALNVGHAGVMSLVYGGLAAMVVMCACMGCLVYKHIRVGVELVTQIAIPAAAACVVGLLCIFLGKALSPHVGSLVTIIVCFVISLGVYWVMLLMLRSFREQEIKYIPGGQIIQAIGRALHVF